MVTLTAGGWTAELLPAVGGAIGALRYDGADVLRPAAPHVRDPLATGSFPLVPFANRIADGRFTVAGRTMEVTRNFGDHPHAIHGLGWQRMWRVANTAADRATLMLEHRGDADWPWPFEAEQRFTLSPYGLTVRLSFVSRSETAVPVGLGFHPYFAADPEARVLFASDRVWSAGPTQLPLEALEPDSYGDWVHGDTVGGRPLVDFGYQDWTGEATIERRDLTVTLRATGARDLHVYIPPGQGFVCLEPVTHLPDAFNRGERFDMVEPGGSLAIEMTVACRATSR